VTISEALPGGGGIAHSVAGAAAVALAKEEAFACWHSAVAQSAMAGQDGGTGDTGTLRGENALARGRGNGIYAGVELLWFLELFSASRCSSACGDHSVAP
jgi:hypothetical protein